MINYLTEQVKFDLRDKRKISDWIKETIREETTGNKVVGDIAIVFTSDEYLREINIKFLKKDYYTDIISFDNSTEKKISGDLIISKERVKENSIQYSQSFCDELHRVVIHGILHILGYNDLIESEKEIMSKKEDYYLAKRGWINNAI